MNNFLAGLRGIQKAYIISVVVVLGLVLSLVLYANGTVGRVAAALRGDTAVAVVNPQTFATATLPPMTGMPGMETPTPMPGMGATDTTMPGMVMPTNVPDYAQPANPDDLGALTMQMQEMMNSLQLTMGQLEQKGTGAYLPPTATPVAVDIQAIMVELQSINRDMGPLMVRIQADLQGNPSPEELASVRAQVQQINARVGNLLMQLQMAQGITSPGMATMPGMNIDPSVSGMAGMGGMQGMAQPTQPAYGYTQDPTQAARVAQLDQMMQQMQVMLRQMQSGGTTTQPGMGAMPGMAVATPTPMAGMAGMSTPSMSMDDMMMKMDDMMKRMDNMMGMSGSSSTSGMSMATPTADPAMGGMMMDDMMMMMDSMMMMMDQMMGMDMMGMPDM